MSNLILIYAGSNFKSIKGLYLLMCIFLYYCLSLYHISLHTHLGGGDAMAYFTVKLNLVNNLGLLGILGLTISFHALTY